MVTLPPAGGDDVHLWFEWVDEPPRPGDIALSGSSTSDPPPEPMSAARDNEIAMLPEDYWS